MIFLSITRGSVTIMFFEAVTRLNYGKIAALISVGYTKTIADCEDKLESLGTTPELWKLSTIPVKRVSIMKSTVEGKAGSPDS